MLRKVFTREGVVISIAEVGSEGADVSHPLADDYRFVENDSIPVRLGYTLSGGAYAPAAPPPPVPLAMQQAVIAAVQARLDAFARTRNYSSIHTAAAYATSKKTKFKKEGIAAVDAMSDTWAALYTAFDEVVAGTRPKPASFADVEPLLPVLAWPA